MPKVKIGVLVSGGGTNLQALLDSVSEGGINGEIAVVISDREDAFALERAKRYGIETLYIAGKNMKEELLCSLQDHEVELVVLAGFLTILPPEIVKVYEGRIINIHPSLIPAFCGKGFYGEKVHEAVIAYGVKVTGATVHFVDEGTDSGPIILQETVAVDEDDDAESIAAKVLKLEHKMLPQAVRLFCEGSIQIEGRKVLIKG